GQGGSAHPPDAARQRADGLPLSVPERRRLGGSRSDAPGDPRAQAGAQGAEGADEGPEARLKGAPIRLVPPFRCQQGAMNWTGRCSAALPSERLTETLPVTMSRPGVSVSGRDHPVAAGSRPRARLRSAPRVPSLRSSCLPSTPATARAAPRAWYAATITDRRVRPARSAASFTTGTR